MADFFLCLFSPFFYEFSIYSGRKVKPAKLSTGHHLNLCIDDGLTFAQLTVSLWLASASSLFSHLWLRSLLKALTHTLVCAWSRWTPTSSQHHGPWLLTGCESLTRSPLSEYQSAAFFEHVGVTHVLVLRGSRQPGWESNHPDVVGATGEQSDQNALSRTWQALTCCHWFCFDGLGSAYFWRRSVMLSLNGSFIDRKKTAWEMRTSLIPVIIHSLDKGLFILAKSRLDSQSLKSSSVFFRTRKSICSIFSASVLSYLHKITGAQKYIDCLIKFAYKCKPANSDTKPNTSLLCKQKRLLNTQTIKEVFPQYRTQCLAPFPAEVQQPPTCMFEHVSVNINVHHRLVRLAWVLYLCQAVPWLRCTQPRRRSLSCAAGQDDMWITAAEKALLKWRQ